MKKTTYTWRWIESNCEYWLCNGTVTSATIKVMAQHYRLTVHNANNAIFNLNSLDAAKKIGTLAVKHRTNINLPK